MPANAVTKGDAIDVVVPVFNEESGLHAFHRRIRALELPLRLIYVDNASTDGSIAILESFEDVRIIRHARNQGYGASLRDGMAASTAPVVVIIDADCEYPPEALPRLIEALADAPVVYASRFVLGTHPYMPLLKRLGNGLITGLFNLLFREHHTDLYTGCKALRRDVVQQLKLDRDGYEQVLEMAVQLARKGIRVKDVPIDFEPRQTDRSKMRHLSETAKFLYLLFHYALTPTDSWRT